MDSTDEKYQALQRHCADLTQKLVDLTSKQSELERQLRETASVQAENETLRNENKEVTELQQKLKTLEDELAHAKHVLNSIANSSTFKLAQKLAVILKRISQIIKR